MLKKPLYMLFLSLMFLTFNLSQSYADTIEVAPIPTFKTASGLFDSLDDYISMYDQIEVDHFDQCMASAEGQMYWFCIKYNVRDTLPHPNLNDGFTNGLPHEYLLPLHVYSDRSAVDGHVITDEDVEEGGLGAKVGWRCPEGYSSRTTGPANNKTLICYIPDVKSCSIGNPIDIVSGIKYEIETDYQSPNGLLKVERRYISQKSGWLMSAEPRLQFLEPSQYQTTTALFHGVSQQSCTDYVALSVIKPNGNGGWGYRDVTRCAPYINTDPMKNRIYLWLNGNRYRMEEQNGRYLREGGHDKELIVEPVSNASVAGAAWRLHQADGSFTYFNSNGRILSRVFMNSDRVDYLYNGFLLSQKTDQNGRSLTYQYSEDENNRLTSVTLPDGQHIRYEYNDNDNIDSTEYWLLKRVIWPDNSVIEYTYNESGYIFNTGERYLTGKFDAYGNRIGTYKYGYFGGAYSTEGYDGANKRTISSRRPGRFEITSSNGRVDSLFFYASPTTSTPLLSRKIQPLSGSKSFGYDADDQLTIAHDYKNNTVQYAYDPVSKLKTVSVTGITGIPGVDLTEDGVILPSGARKQATQWDNDLRKPLKTAEPKLITTYVYNGNPDPFNDDMQADCSSAEIDGTPLPVVCRVVRQATTDENGSQGLNATLDPETPARHQLYTYNDAGQLLTIAHSPDYQIETTYTYYADAGATHKQGDLESITNSLGHQMDYLAYDDHGNPTQIRDANGVLSEMSYDHRNRLTSYTIAGLTTTLAYDLNGNLETVSTPDGQTLTWEYDGAGRPSALVDTQMNRLEYGYDLEGNRLSETYYDAMGEILFSKTYEYDALNRLEKSIDALTEETTYDYDAEGNLTTTTDANLNPSNQAYDALDRLKQQTDALDGTTQYTYDAQDNLTSVTDPNGLTTTYDYDGLGNLISQTSPDTGTTTYTYDEVGNRLTKTDARGITVNYSYDALNRLTHISYPDTSLNVTYTYDQGTDGIGKLTRISDTNGTTTYAYNAYGDLITQTRTSSDSIVTTFSYDYDTYGRLASLTYPSGNSVNYTYDAQGQLSGLSYEWSDGATQSLIGNLQTLPFGPVKAFDYGNGLSLTRGFDQDYQLISQTIPGILQSSYQHDPVGNITDWQDLLSTGQNQLFDYDALYRLTSANGAYGDITYTYDATGNRLSLTLDGSTETYSYVPSSHRLQQILGSVTDSRSYDAAGNTIQSLIGSYTYDDTNRMVSFSKTGTTATYAYNGKGERISKSVDGTITRFRYAPAGQLLGEYDQNGQAIREYITLEGQPVGLVVTDPVTTLSSVYYLHTDHLGAVVKATDSTQTLVWDAERKPFGERSVTTAQIEMPLGFPGQYFDEETGNYYNYFRDYDPTTGRYLQSDPIGLDGGINTYTYAINNPLYWIDPTGEAICGGVCVGAAIGIGARAVVQYATRHAGAAIATGMATQAMNRSWRDKKGRWKVYVRCNIESFDRCQNCPSTIGGWGYGNTFGEANSNAQHDANENLSDLSAVGCYKRHCDPVACFENGRPVRCPRSGRGPR